MATITGKVTLVKVAVVPSVALSLPNNGIFTFVPGGVLAASELAANIGVGIAGTVIVTVAVEHLVPSILSHILYVNVSVPEKPAFGV